MSVRKPDRKEVEDVAALFALLGEPNRLRMVLACLDGPIGVGAIAAEAGLSPSLASHHLRLLRTGRLLRAERAGKAIRYALDDAHVAEVVRTMVAHVCDPHEHHTGPADPDEREGESDG